MNGAYSLTRSHLSSRILQGFVLRGGDLALLPAVQHHALTALVFQVIRLESELPGHAAGRVPRQGVWPLEPSIRQKLLEFRAGHRLLVVLGRPKSITKTIIQLNDCM